MPPRIIFNVIHAQARKTLSQPPAGQEQLKDGPWLMSGVLTLEVLEWGRGVST